jgi:hypothetical protein
MAIPTTLKKQLALSLGVNEIAGKERKNRILKEA